jgi:hypothetical protein
MAKRKNDGYGFGSSTKEGWDGQKDLPISVQRKMQAKAVTLDRKQKRQEKRNYEND